MEDLKKVISERWKKVPFWCMTMTEESISELLEKGSVSRQYTPYEEKFNCEQAKFENGGYSKDEDWFITIGDSISIKEDNTCSSIAYTSSGIDYTDYVIETSRMKLDENNNLIGTICNINFKINDKGEVELYSTSKKIDDIIKLVSKNKTIATHYGDDLDNKSSIYAVEQFMKNIGILQQDENLNVERVQAGKVKEGCVNLDTGGHTGNRTNAETDTIVIDGDLANGVKSACCSLANLGIYVPEQIQEFADARPTSVSALDARSGLALIRYLSGEQAFKLAEDQLLDKSLTDEQLEKYGLSEAHKKQQGIIDRAVDKINKYTVELQNGEKMVLAPEQILGGSAVAYEKGIPYFVSITQHYSEKEPDGVTFAITCKPGMKLPENVLNYGKELVEQYRIDERTSGVFVNPNGQLVVAGGPKNPDFKVNNVSTVEEMAEQVANVFGGIEPTQYLKWLKNRKEDLSQEGRKIDEIDNLIMRKESAEENQEL